MLFTLYKSLWPLQPAYVLAYLTITVAIKVSTVCLQLDTLNAKIIPANPTSSHIAVRNGGCCACVTNHCLAIEWMNIGVKPVTNGTLGESWELGACLAGRDSDGPA